jgi:hypothetical protein
MCCYLAAAVSVSNPAGLKAGYGMLSLKTAGVMNQNFHRYSPKGAEQNLGEDPVFTEIDDLGTDSPEIPSSDTIELDDSQSINKALIVIRNCTLIFSESNKFFLSKYFPRV